MNSVAIRNSRIGAEPLAPPTHDDGHRYPYSLTYDAGKYVGFADTIEDLLGLIIPGYEGLEPDQQLEKRILCAINAQVATQSQINANADASVLAAISEDERAVLTGPRHTQPAVDVWECPITLVLVDTGYAPYGVLDVPLSDVGDTDTGENLLWIKPLDDWEFLESLHAIGYVQLAIDKGVDI